MRARQSEQISLSAKTVVVFLGSITAALTVAHVAALVVYYWVDDEDQFDFVRLIDMDYEANLPTLFSAFLFLGAAVLFWLLYRAACIAEEAGKHSHSGRLNWLGLALLFCFLAADEGAKLHEHVGDFMEQYVEAEGLLYFPWVIPYLVVFSFLVILYFPFFLRLSGATQKGLVLSAVLFLAGAVIMDMLGGWEADRNGTTSILYSVFYTVEEVLEMAGLIVLIKTLIDTLAAQGTTIQLQSSKEC